MDQRSVKIGFATAGLLCCAVGSGPAMGYVPHECTLSGVSEANTSTGVIGCTTSSGGGGTSLIAIGSASTAPIGTAGVNAIWGAKVDSTTTAMPIDAWNMCRWIDMPSTPGSRPIFVPLKTQNEYTQGQDH